MNRLLVFLGTIAVAFITPAMTLAAPPTAVPVRGGPVARPVVTRSTDAGRSETCDQFKVPYDVNVQAKPLPGSLHYDAPHYQALHNEAPLYRYTARGQQANPSYFLYQPAWYQSACYAGNGFGAPAAPFAPTSSTSDSLAGVSIGSLVDQDSKNVFSMTPSYKPGLASNGAGVAAASPFSLQYEFHTTPCGTANTFTP